MHGIVLLLNIYILVGHGLHEILLAVNKYTLVGHGLHEILLAVNKYVVICTRFHCFFGQIGVSISESTQVMPTCIPDVLLAR